MPGTYQVTNRLAPTAKAGLGLPLPPANGPIVLENGNAGLRYAAMGGLLTGNVNTFGFPGIWTDSISDCVILAAVEWDPLVRNWTNFCWMHLNGGLYKPWRDAFRLRIANPAGAWGLIASRDWIGTDTLRTKFNNWGIPNNQVSVYISRRDFKFGLRFFGGFWGEL